MVGSASAIFSNHWETEAGVKAGVDHFRFRFPNNSLR